MHDIEALEEAWKRYHFKRRILPAVAGGVAAVALAGFWLFTHTADSDKRPLSTASTTKTAQNTPTIQTNTPKQQTPQRPTETAKNVATTAESAVPASVKKQKASTPVPTSASPAEPTQKIEPDLAFLTHFKDNGNPQNGHKATARHKTVRPASVRRKESVASKEVVKPAPVKNATVSDEPKKQTRKSGALVITSKKTNNTLKTLIRRFNESKDPKLATYIAQSYYRKGNYRETVRWSIIANSIEPGNEMSWLLFAKAKVALGKKEDAINALRTYLNQYSSKKIKAYLEVIEASVWQ